MCVLGVVPHATRMARSEEQIVPRTPRAYHLGGAGDGDIGGDSRSIGLDPAYAVPLPGEQTVAV